MVTTLFIEHLNYQLATCNIFKLHLLKE